MVFGHGFDSRLVHSKMCINAGVIEFVLHFVLHMTKSLTEAILSVLLLFFFAIFMLKYFSSLSFVVIFVIKVKRKRSTSFYTRKGILLDFWEKIYPIGFWLKVFC